MELTEIGVEAGGTKPATEAPAGTRLCSRGCHVLPAHARFDPHTGAPLADAPAPGEPTVASPRTRGSWAQLVVRALAPLVAAVAGLIVLGLLAITVGPRVLPYQALIVRSGSMSPTIPTGSIVFYHKVAAAKVKVGDVIVFSEPGDPSRQVTHRVHAVKRGPTGPYFVTKGDANGTPDNWQVPAVGTGWVAGMHLPYVGYLVSDLQSRTARLLLLLIPALLLGAITLYEIWRDKGTAKAT